MTNILDTRHEDKPRNIESFQEGIGLLNQIREKDTKLSRKEIIPIIKGTIDFADTTEKLLDLFSWITPGHDLDKSALEKLIKIAKTKEELEDLLEKKLVEIDSNLGNSWKQREREITANRG